MSARAGIVFAYSSNASCLRQSGSKVDGEWHLRRTRPSLTGTWLRPIRLPLPRMTLLEASFILAMLTLPIDARLATADDISHETGRVKLKALLEVSGMAASGQNPGILWMHNDGGSRHVYAVKTTGKVVSQVLPDVRAEDLEDIAIGPGPDPGVDYIYLGDIGDNDLKRREIRVIRLAEPSLQSGPGQPGASSGQALRLAYPDGPHDAEALMVDPRTGDLVIATKERDVTRLYVARSADLKSDSLTKLSLAATLDVGNVSAGDMSRNGTWIALRREETGWLWNRANGESLRATLAKRPRSIPVLGARQAKNGESIAFHPDSRGYFTISEGRQGSIYFFELPTPLKPLGASEK